MSDKSKEINSIKDSIFNKKKESSVEETILWIAHEFKMSYDEVMDLPIPAYFVYIDFLNKMYAQKEKAASKRGKR